MRLAFRRFGAITDNQILLENQFPSFDSLRYTLYTEIVGKKSRDRSG